MFEDPFNVDKDPVVKLIDFGFSREFGNERDMFTACGSTLYIAPEVCHIHLVLSSHVLFCLILS